MQGVNEWRASVYVCMCVCCTNCVCLFAGNYTKVCAGGCIYIYRYTYIYLRVCMYICLFHTSILSTLNYAGHTRNQLSKQTKKSSSCTIKCD